MKKIITMVLLASLCITACACSMQTSNPGVLDESLQNSIVQGTETDSTTNEVLPIPKPEHVILLDGSITTDQYTLVADGEGCYVSFMEEYMATESELNACRSGEIHFDSIADMVDSLKNSRFEKDEQIIMQAAFPKTDKGIVVCDLNRLYDATTPEETVVQAISLSGQYYDFVIAQEEMFESGWIVYTSEKAMNQVKSRMYVWTDGATITRDENSSFDGVPCRIVEYHNTTESYRDIYIEVEQDGKKMDVVLRYLLKDERQAPERVSDTAPWQMLMFCEDDGAFYRVTIGNMLQTPTYNWISSFGLTPYIPDVANDVVAE